MAKRTIKENYMPTITKNKTLNLSDQALGAVMLALQNSLMTQTDIVPVLKGFNFIFDDASGLVVTNPPILRVDSGEEETVPTEE
jgi:hypothetical protein